MSDISDLRTEIDRIDDSLTSLFERRLCLAERIAQYKRDNDMPVFDKSRELDIISAQCSKVPDRHIDLIKQFYISVFDISRRLQQNIMSAQSSPSDVGID